MGKVAFGVIGLVIGLVGGTVFGGSLLSGTAAGVGIATGLSAGICSTVIAASEEGLLTNEEVAQVLSRAANNMGGAVSSDADLVGSVEECESVMQRLRTASAE